MTVTHDDILGALKRLTVEQREAMLKVVTPRVIEPYMAHIPHPKQQFFLTLSCREAMYGGAAGGGKSDAILMAALQYVDVPGYSALILRRTWPDLNAPGAILDRARTWLMPTDALQRDGGRTWVFPSGAKLTFGYIQHDKDKYKFQSAEYQFIGFDELTHFEEGPYTYLFSRLRRPDLVCLNCSRSVRRNAKHGWYHTDESRAKHPVKCTDLFPDPKVLEQYTPSEVDGMTVFNVPLRMRAATNPGGIGNEWVKQRFVDKKTRVPGTVFVPAKLIDNPSLDRETYRESLSHLTEVDRLRLENGDWDVAEAGDFFQRAWWRPLSVFVQDKSDELCRYWDLASTEGGGDYTAGILLARKRDGNYEIRDIIRGQWSAANIEKVIKQTAELDGRWVPVRMEQEPGSSGKNIISHYMRNVLNGYNFDGVRPTGEKTARAYPVKVAAEKGLIGVCACAQTLAFLNETEAFPAGANDDMVDALSGAFEAVNFGSRARLLA